MTFSRRRLFGFFADAARDAASAAGAEPRRTAAAESARETEAFEDALEIIAVTGPEYGGGLSNHAPMVADALLALARPQAIRPWVERYRRSLSAPPSGRNPIEGEWREALGDFSRHGDWVVFFRRAIAERPWREVLSDWTTRLAPGASAAAFHGLLRTAHAARSLGRFDSPARRRELAEGLAYWAARFRALPDTGGWRTDTRLPSEALPAVELLPDSERAEGGSIDDALQRLASSAAFAGVAGLIDSSLDGSRVVSDMAETFAGAYLVHSTGSSAIALLHAVTGPSAVRLLLPYLDDRTRRVLLRFAWQAAAGIYAVYGRPDAGPVPTPPLMGREGLIDRAVATGDEHAIKLAEAALRENAVMPQPVFLAAALDGVSRFGPNWP
ncbi:MAG TPA: questin oxidase family protein [Anaeromyxobacter sp.]